MFHCSLNVSVVV